MAADVQESINLRLIGLDHKKQDVKLLRRPIVPKLKPLSETMAETNAQFCEIFAPDTAFSEFDKALSCIDDSNTTVISPPPPSTDFYADSTIKQTRLSKLSSSQSKKNKVFSRYLLDSSNRERTHLGTYVEGNTELVKLGKVKGPDAFFTKLKPRRMPFCFEMEDIPDEELRYIKVPEFTLKDFISNLSENCKLSLEKVEKIVYSKHNYKKIVSIVEKILINERNKNTTNHELNTIILDGEKQGLPKVEQRKPNRQFLLEVAQLVKDEMVANGLMNKNSKATIKTVKKFDPNIPGGMTAHSEIIVYEKESNMRRIRNIDERRSTEVPASSGLFKSNTTRTFMGSGRCSSPFETIGGEDVNISPAELAVLDSLLGGGIVLSLKACFISSLPDIEPVFRTLTYLNLSFNIFTEIPNEVFNLRHLQTLKLRDNPIRSINADICKLRKLRIFVASFCMITTLPVSLFTLENLQHLDVSYNKLSFLPNDLQFLSYLRELNVEGNQLPAMPSGCLCLINLRKLNVRNNLMHPLFWNDNTKNEPQRLIDLAATTFDRSSLYFRYETLDNRIVDILNSRIPCECCGQAMFGTGFRMIIPVSKLFGIRHIPLLFRSCSPECRQNFKNNPNAFVNALYGQDNE